ncbi:MAG: hypothetical protein JRF61_09125 [Deltaproteobacteria bacterium]|nr:hypothetical protein [Deltaproteobacteria bacterium]
MPATDAALSAALDTNRADRHGAHVYCAGDLREAPERLRARFGRDRARFGRDRARFGRDDG